MKKYFFIICMLFVGIAFGEQNSSISSLERKMAAVCQGHEMVYSTNGSFEKAKASKDKWDEQTPYDRSIKECNSEMYREDNRWIIEYSWTHVDNCPKCDKHITMEVPVESTTGKE